MNDYRQKTNKDLERVLQLIQSAPNAPADSMPLQRLVLIGGSAIVIISVMIGALFALKPSCDIKAIVREKGHFYYLLNDPYYSSAKTNQPGDMMLCTEQEAIDGGFTRRHYPKHQQSKP